MKYAYFDPNNNGKVIQWIDTEAASYNLPDDSMLYTCTDAEWLLQQQDDMMVSGGKLMPYAVPKPSAAQLLAQAQQAQLALIDAACATAITGGFQSSALGKAYTYPSQQTDQANLSANVVSSLLPDLPADWTTLQICCDENGKWGYMPHTVAQIQQVGIDGKAVILGYLTKNAQLQAQIAAAATVAAVQAITW